MSDNQNSDPSLAVQLEGLLFVAAEPVGLAELAEALEIPVKTVEDGLSQLELALEGRGLRLQRHTGRIQLTTAPALADSIERFLGLEARTHLSRSALETLAIIAYNQPVTRPQIESIRGVNSDSMLRSLLSKGLILELGRMQGPGRPFLYSTTPEFLQHFGLSSVSELPPLKTAGIEVGPDAMLKD
jgi:segregation and condensation protein B